MFWTSGTEALNWGYLDYILKWGCCWKLGLLIEAPIYVFVIWFDVWRFIVNSGLAWSGHHFASGARRDILSSITNTLCNCLCWSCITCVLFGENSISVPAELLSKRLRLPFSTLILFIMVPYQVMVNTLARTRESNEQ